MDTTKTSVISLSSKKITPKQRKWLKVYTQTLNATEAAMQAYDCKNRDVAKDIGYQNLAKLDFDDLLERVGLTDEYIIKGIREGTQATKPLVIGDKPHKIEDYAVRKGYFEVALKLKGKLSDRVELTGKDGEPIRIDLLAGVAFLPPNVRKDTSTEDTGDAQVATGGYTTRPPQIQSPSVAQES